METRKCVICKKPFTPRNCKHLTCSKECSYERVKRAAAERHRRLYHDPASGFRERQLAYQRATNKQRNDTRNARNALLRRQAESAGRLRRILRTVKELVTEAYALGVPGDAGANLRDAIYEIKKGMAI